MFLTLSVDFYNILLNIKLEFILLFITAFILVLGVVLVERKNLAILQRRLGPTLLGRNGIRQIFADLFKALKKETLIFYKNQNDLAFTFTFIFFFFNFAAITNFSFGLNIFFFKCVQYSILISILISILDATLVLFIGFIAMSRYSFIGSTRIVIFSISVELLITILYAILIFYFNSLNAGDLAYMQDGCFTILLGLPISGLYIIICIVESKRSPFDHVENENELIAGYNIEYPGYYLLIIYLIEYLHLVMASLNFTIMFGGGYGIIIFFLSWINSFNFITLPITNLNIFIFFIVCLILIWIKNLRVLYRHMKFLCTLMLIVCLYLYTIAILYKYDQLEYYTSKLYNIVLYFSVIASLSLIYLTYIYFQNN